MAFGRAITGDKAVIKNLSTLANRTQRKILRKVVRRVQKPMITSARQIVHRRSGQLAKSLGTVVRTYKGTSVIAVLGPRAGFRAVWEGKEIDPIRYAHLVEQGHRGVSAYPFLRPAFDSNKESAKQQAIAEIAKEIEKEAEKK
jgi:HK97 gp10 family phage protein